MQNYPELFPPARTFRNALHRFAIAATVALIGQVWIAPEYARAATPIEECALSVSPLACLDAKLRQVNLRLNAALKLAQDRIEKLQREGRRPVQSAFINSQRQFNAYRDANCAWQAIAVQPSSSSEFIKDCQIRLTLEREQELLAFGQGTEAAPVPAPTSTVVEDTEPESTKALPEMEADVQASARPQAAASEPGQEVERPAARMTEWRLQSWTIDGAERELVADSAITIAFDPSGKFEGNASVNAFSGTYRFRNDGGLEWPRAGFAVTKKAGAQPLMRQEQAFLETLRRMYHYRVDGETLILESASRRTVLTFGR